MVLARRGAARAAELLVPRHEERGAAPPARPGPLPAGRPAVALGTVPADPPAPVGRGLRGAAAASAGPVPDRQDDDQVGWLARTRRETFFSTGIRRNRALALRRGVPAHRSEA